MADREPASLWSGTADGAEADSIAAHLASTIEAPRPAPDDAMGWAAVAGAYEREAAAAGAGPAAASLLFEAGRILEERLGDERAALDVQRRALEADPAYVPAARALRRLALDAGDDALAAEAVRVEARGTPDPEARAELLVLCARLLAALGKDLEAREALLEASTLAPGSFAAAEENARRAAARGDRAALADAYVRCARTVRDRRLAAHFLSAAGALQEEALGDTATAGALALEAFALLSSDPLLRGAARRHAERLGRLDVLPEILRADAETAQGVDASDAWLALARAEERLGRLDAAAQALARGRAASPRDAFLLAELSRLEEARGRYAEASDALAALAEACAARLDPAGRREAVAAWLRRAEIEETELGRVDDAIACCRSVLTVDPGHRAALAALGRLCARAGEWEGVLAAFEGEATAAKDPRERGQRLFRAGEVLEQHLGRTDLAVRRYREALALDPALLAARSALERLYAREDRWEEHVALIESDLAQSAGGAERAALLGDARWRTALLQRRAEILENHADLERAREAWEAVRLASPAHVPALRALGRLHARAGRWEELAEMYRAEADAAADPESAADLVRRQGEILERKLGRTDEAVAAYREALMLEPALLPAIQALARLYRARDEHESLVEILRAQAARAAPPERAAALAEAGRISEERLGDVEHAIESYEEALRARPGFAPAIRALDRLYAEAGRSAELTQLRRSAGADLDAADRGERLLRLARLEADRVGDARAGLRAADELALALGGHPAALLLQLRLAADPEKRARARLALADAATEPTAAAALLVAAAVDLRPASARRDALARAAGLVSGTALLAPWAARRLRQAGHPAALARLAEALRDAAPDPASRVARSLEAGEAWEAAADAERALAAFRTALEIAPSYLPALRAARGLYARRNDWAAVRSTLQAEGASLRDAREAASAWIDAGEIAEQKFADTDAAAADYRRAAERDPADPAPLARLEALLGPAAALPILDVHEARARAAPDGGRAAEAWFVAARAAVAAGVPERALDALDRTLVLKPHHGAALTLRARLRAEAGNHAGALEDCEACLALGGEPGARVPLHLAAAVLLDEQLGDPRRAASHLEAALDLSPEHAEGLTRLSRIAARAGRSADAAALLRRLVRVPGLAHDVLSAHYLSLADAEVKLGRADDALVACRRALEIAPGSTLAIRKLIRLESERGDPRGLVPVVEAAAEAARDPSVRADLHLEAARLHAGPLRSRSRAIEHLRAALEHDPARDDVRAALAEALEDSSPALAAEQHRLMLARDPLRADSWTALYRLFDRSRAHDRAYVAATVLRWLGAPPPDRGAERLLAEADRQALPAPPVLSEDDWRALRDPADCGPAADVVAAAGDAIAEAVAVSWDRRGQPLRDDHPFRALLADLARALSAAPYELYGGEPGELALDPGAPHGLLVGPDVPRRTTAREQRFLLGRAAARLRARSGLAEALTPSELADAVAAAVRVVVPSYAGLGRPSDELLRRVGRALSRRARRTLEEPARALAVLPSPPDLAAWAQAAAATADRAGLVLSGDLPSALGVLLRDADGRAPQGARAIAAARARPEARALLVFASTDAHFALRQRLRVAIA
jgi:tetratricopeptide (TPR) repeat protein